MQEDVVTGKVGLVNRTARDRSSVEAGQQKKAVQSHGFLKSVIELGRRTADENSVAALATRTTCDAQLKLHGKQNESRAKAKDEVMASSPSIGVDMVGSDNVGDYFKSMSTTLQSDESTAPAAALQRCNTSKACHGSDQSMPLLQGTIAQKIHDSTMHVTDDDGTSHGGHSVRRKPFVLSNTHSVNTDSSNSDKKTGHICTHIKGSQLRQVERSADVNPTGGSADMIQSSGAVIQDVVHAAVVQDGGEIEGTGYDEIFILIRRLLERHLVSSALLCDYLCNFSRPSYVLTLHLTF